MPSWPSGETRWAAIRLVVSPIRSFGLSSATSRINALAAATALGPDVSTSAMRRSTAASSSASATTSCTSPSSRALAAPNRLPVRNSSRAADTPILRTT